MHCTGEITGESQKPAGAAEEPANAAPPPPPPAAETAPPPPPPPASEPKPEPAAPRAAAAQPPPDHYVWQRPIIQAQTHRKQALMKASLYLCSGSETVETVRFLESRTCNLLYGSWIRLWIRLLTSASKKNIQKPRFLQFCDFCS
jgi:hypothetical protein